MNWKIKQRIIQVIAALERAEVSPTTACADLRRILLLVQEDELRQRAKELEAYNDWEAANNIIDNMNTMDKATGSPTGSKA